jgi:hypothetical protein
VKERLTAGKQMDADEDTLERYNNGGMTQCKGEDRDHHDRDRH